MLHLFNKVYLELDNNIDINFDRVVISERYGTQMYHVLDKIAYGILLTYGKTVEGVIGKDFSGFISSLRDHSNTSGKKIIIYCDNDSYKKFITKWFKSIFPNLDFDSFKSLVDHTIYNKRILSNTQFSSVYSMNLSQVWEGFDDIKTYWEKETGITEAQKELLDGLHLKYSYEFLLATYLSGDNSYYEEFKQTAHMFLKRWFKELLADNRQMVLLNINNHLLLKSLDIDPKLVDITKQDPLEGIDVLESYSDDEIWEKDFNKYGECKLEGLSEEKALKLFDTAFNIYEKYEGMLVNESLLDVMRTFILSACRDNMTDEELETFVEFIINKPFDTCCIPRFDFENVNYALFQHFLTQKFNGNDLSNYRLL